MGPEQVLVRVVGLPGGYHRPRRPGLVHGYYFDTVHMVGNYAVYASQNAVPAAAEMAAHAYVKADPGGQRHAMVDE